MKTVSKAFVLLVAAVAAFIVSFSAMPAWAEGENIVTDPSDGMCVTHTMFTNSATSEGGINYSVDFAPITSGVDSGFSTTGHATIASVVFAPASDSADSGSSEWTRSYTKQVVLPSANAFPHAGAWMYTISETATGAAATDSTKWVNSEATYKFRVYIENDDVNGGLKYGAWSVERIDANDGTALAEPEKVDATYPPATTSGLYFSSQYIKTQTLTVTKEVEGTFADKTHEFPISVKLTLPDWYHDPASADLAPSISYTDTSNTAQTGTPVYNSTSGTWELVISDGYAHSHSLTATVPVGTRYAIDETNPNASGLAYTPSVTWNVGLPPAVTYDANGGSGDTAQTRLSAGAVAANSTFTAPNDKVFLCWNTETDGTGDNYLPGDELPTGDAMILYARWVSSPVTIKYMGYDDSYYDPNFDGELEVLAQRTYSLDDAFVNIDSSYTGFDHYGWYSSESKRRRKAIEPTMTIRKAITVYETDVSNGTWDGSSPIEVFASQEERYVTVHYVFTAPEDKNTGVGPGDQNFSWTDDSALIPTASCEGHSFVGWAVTPNATSQDIISRAAGITTGEIMQAALDAGQIISLSETSVTLYAIWQANAYTVVYDYGYDSLTENDTAYGYDGRKRLVDKVPTYTKPGSTFVEWNTRPDGSGVHVDPSTRYYAVTAFNSADELNTTTILYAIWS